MEFLVEFEVNVPAGTPTDEVADRETAEASAAARLAHEGHLVRLWKLPTARGRTRAVGLYRADSTAQLDGLIDALPLADWMRVTVTQLAPHPNDPVGPGLRPQHGPSRAGADVPLGAGARHNDQLKRSRL